MGSGSTSTTLAFIGCGNMGSAILSGLLDATRQPTVSDTTVDDTNGTGRPRISRFIVNTKTTASAERLRVMFAADADRVQIYAGQNVRAMQEADIVLLACKPFLAEDILRETGVYPALKGKFVISIMGGKPPSDIREYIRLSAHDKQSTTSSEFEQGLPTIVRAMPNVAARLRRSMTIIELVVGLPGELSEMLTWMFEQIGRVKIIESNLFDVGTMLVGATMAMMTVPLEGILDGCVVEGIRRGEAMEMMAQVMEGMGGLLSNGVHPALLRESISSPRGCTIQGILAVEKEGVRGTFAEGMLNGTRHLRK